MEKYIKEIEKILEKLENREEVINELLDRWDEEGKKYLRKSKNKPDINKINQKAEMFGRVLNFLDEERLKCERDIENFNAYLKNKKGDE